MTHILHLSKSALVYTPVRKRLAVALSQNDTLTGLDLSYNSVTPAAAMVLAFALKVCIADDTSWASRPPYHEFRRPP